MTERGGIESVKYLNLRFGIQIKEKITIKSCSPAVILFFGTIYLGKIQLMSNAEKYFHFHLFF